MNKKISLVLITILLLVSTGCEKKEKKEVRETFNTSKYYQAHSKEMLARVKECQGMNYPTATERADCDNAYSANVYYDLAHRK